MKIDYKKLARQQKGISKWRNSKEQGSFYNGFGTIWWITGMGKTFAAIHETINPFLDKKPTETVIVLVHREELKKQWTDRVNKFLKKEHKTQITVQTVQYYIKNGIVPTCSLLIVDEVHKFYGQEFFTYINGTNIKRKFLLCLTATYKDPENRQNQLENIGCSVIDHITEEEAIENGWISNYIEYNLGINMTNDEVIRYKEISEFTNKNLSKFGRHGFHGAKKCLSGDDDYDAFKYCIMWAKANGYKPEQNGKELSEKQLAINSVWSPNLVMGYAKNVFKGIREKVKFTNECYSKLEAVMNIIKRFNNSKIMSFSESTIFADRIERRLNKTNPDSCVVYHSQLSSRPLKDENGDEIVYGKSAKKAGQVKLFGIKTLKKVYIEKFLNNEVKILSTARALDEGFDCNDIEIAIISSRSRNFNQQKQRKGRSVRVIPERPKTIILVINVFLKGTRDQESLIAAQRKASNKVYWIDSIDEIQFNPNKNSFQI
jgi:superfamily II DNA or RNA helicase